MIRPFDAALALKNPLQIMCLQSVVPSEAYEDSFTLENI